MRLFSTRSRYRSVVYVIFGFISFYLIYLIYKLNDDLTEENEITTCQISSATLDELKELAITLRDLLDSLNLKYFLCYLTLYGAIKNHQPIPWHSSLDFCILNDQIINRDESYIIRQFIRKKLSIRYSTKNGFYKINFEGNTSVHAKLFVFEKDDYTNSYRRIGLSSRVIPPDQCSLIHCFPHRLIESPLPLTQFITQDKYAIPHEGEEILKYFYPDNWHQLDNVPAKCV